MWANYIFDAKIGSAEGVTLKHYKDAATKI